MTNAPSSPTDRLSWYRRLLEAHTERGVDELFQRLQAEDVIPALCDPYGRVTP